MQNIKIGNIVEVIEEIENVLFNYLVEVTEISTNEKNEIIAYGFEVNEDNSINTEYPTVICKENFIKII